MMDILDRSKTYLLGVVENTELAKGIQLRYETSLSAEKRWTHCAAAFFNGNGWMVIEARPCFGCHLMPLREWMEAFNDATVERVQAIATPLDIEGMFRHLGKQFAFRYIVKRKAGEYEAKPDCYIFCSELIRRNDFGTLSTDPNDCFPAEYQEKALQMEIPILNLWPEEEFSVPCRMELGRFMEGD